jgi:hypothetical protein
VREILRKLLGPQSSNDELNFGKVVVEEINAGK